MVNVRKRSDRNAVSDAVLLGKPTRVNEPPGHLHILQRESKVDPRLSRRFDLSEHMFSIKRNDCLTGASPHVLANTKSQLEQRLIDRAQCFLWAREHFFNVRFGGSKISLGVAVFAAFAFRSLGEPSRVLVPSPCSV